MSVINKHFDIIINNDNTFYIDKPSSKLKISDVATVLAKIEFIVKNKLSYDSNRNDIYLNKSQSSIFEILGKLSSQIHKKYTETQSSVNWLARAAFSDENQISSIDKRIQDYLNPAQALPLPFELIQEITKYLKVSDISSLARLNRLGQVHAAKAILSRAREFDYEKGNTDEAIEYIKILFKELEEAAKQTIIPEKYIAYKTKSIFIKKIDSEKILQNLQTLTTNDIFSILKNKNLYSPSFHKFRKIFNLIANGKVSKVGSQPMQQKGNVAIVLAAKNGAENLCQLLLQHGANINARDKDGRTPLALAVINKHTAVVKLLIAQGADVNTINVRGNTPLIHSYSIEITRLLLESGRLTTIEHSSNISEIGNALQFSADEGNLEKVELLLKHGANINARDQDGRTPLALAIISKHTAVVKLLIDHGADVNTINVRGNTPLIHSNSAKITRLLLESGRITTIEHSSNITKIGNALQYSARNGNLEIVELLLQYGANINARDQHGRTPLALAKQHRNKEIENLLLLNKAVL